MPTIGRSRVSTARKLEPGAFPDLSLPVPLPLAPMEATRVDQLPDGDEWQFEPKWDGFRCLVFRKGPNGRSAIQIRSAAYPVFS
jgi:ATP-dependent DNA ligase